MAKKKKVSLTYEQVELLDNSEKSKKSKKSYDSDLRKYYAKKGFDLNEQEEIEHGEDGQPIN